MPGMRARVPGRGRPGGIEGYPLDRLFEEVAFVAYHFHWPLADILNLEHPDRERLVKEISAINRRMNEAASAPPEPRGVSIEEFFQ
jgi:hypothetical protein